MKNGEDFFRDARVIKAREPAQGGGPQHAGLLREIEQQWERGGTFCHEERVERGLAPLGSRLLIAERFPHLLERLTVPKDRRERLCLLAHLFARAGLQLFVKLRPARRLRDPALAFERSIQSAQNRRLHLRLLDLTERLHEYGESIRRGIVRKKDDRSKTEDERENVEFLHRHFQFPPAAIRRVMNSCTLGILQFARSSAPFAMSAPTAGSAAYHSISGRL